MTRRLAFKGLLCISNWSWGGSSHFARQMKRRMLRGHPPAAKVSLNKGLRGLERTGCCTPRLTSVRLCWENWANKLQLIKMQLLGWSRKAQRKDVILTLSAHLGLAGAHFRSPAMSQASQQPWEVNQYYPLFTDGETEAG